MPRTFLHYDVFTGEPLLGNQLAVFPDARGLETARMQRIAREMNFSESTFLTPSEWAGTDIRMRIFTPMKEMPSAGHPTIGSTFALAEIGVIRPGTGRFIFHLNVGPTPVDLEWSGDRLRFAWMTQANPAFGPVFDDRAAVAETLGLAADDLLAGAPAQQISCGAPFLLVALKDPETVDRAISDAAAFKRFAKATGTDLPIFLFAMGRLRESSARGSSADDSRSPGSGVDAATRLRESVGKPSSTDSRSQPQVQIYSRMFAPEFGIVEDPATGIASGPLGCYLVHHGLVTPEAATAIVSNQGVAMGRASRIHISIGVTDGVISNVRVGGEAVLVARGELLV
jgi:trans-2,3-dihydro-3-hydroxyanthranilate isomerase